MSASAAAAVRLPKHITPDPILEAVAEVRFLPQPVPDAVFGIIYPLVEGQYPAFEKLPILQLPDEVREKDPNLLFQPHYRLKAGSMTLQIGPRVISLTTSEYDTWHTFATNVLALFRTLEERRVFGAIVRVGLRYINFFEQNILPRSTVRIQMAGESIVDQQIFVRTQVEAAPYVTSIQIATQASVGQPPEARSGSAIDLDTFVTSPVLGEDRAGQFADLLNGAHAELKQRFFALLQPDFVASLNPEYD